MISPTCYDISSWMPRDSRAVTLMLVHQGRRDLTIPFTQVTWVASAKVLDMFGVCLNLAIARTFCRGSSNSAYSWTIRPPYTSRAQGVLTVDRQRHFPPTHWRSYPERSNESRGSDIVLTHRPGDGCSEITQHCFMEPSSREVYSSN